LRIGAFARRTARQAAGIAMPKTMRPILVRESFRQTVSLSALYLFYP
jgi:hypothetical protein